ncbi:MAG: ACT domain-containing protein [Thermoguttaceae bacterium]|nr:ACT domain-containing protein [Thermoguttaceae bacterium]MDO4424682.1 ACT domain-containing protein [Planctomycetia bacterium]
MKIKQLSVYLQNEPGHLSNVCRILGEANIDILTLSLADTQQFGMLRLIVKDWEPAMKLLQNAGCMVKTVDVVATEIPDQPGGLAKILGIIEAANLNVEYMYAFTSHVRDKAVLVFRFNDPDAAVSLLHENGVNVFDSVDLYQIG